VVHVGEIRAQDRHLAVRFIERLQKLSPEQWAVITDRAWAEVRKRPDVLAALVADIRWDEFSTGLIEREELPAAARTELSRRQQTQLVTEMAQRIMAVDVAIEVAIIALSVAPGTFGVVRVVCRRDSLR
jgi:hypothetical protein